MKIRKLWLPPAPLIDSFKVSVESRLAPRFAKIIFLAFLAEMAAMYLAAHLSIRGYLLKGLVDSAVISFILFLLNYTLLMFISFLLILLPLYLPLLFRKDMMLDLLQLYRSNLLFNL